MKRLFIDIETTGLHEKMGEPFHNVPNFPRIVEFAAIMYDDNRQVGALHSIIKPISFTIPEKATEIHGISTEYAMKHGRHRRECFDLLHRMLFSADCVVAHNIAFDLPIVLCELYRHGLVQPNKNAFAGLNTFCTMDSTIHLLKLPRKNNHYATNNGSKYKRPSLTELHTFLFDTDYEDKHTAYADAQIAAKCFFELNKLYY